MNSDDQYVQDSDVHNKRTNSQEINDTVQIYRSTKSRYESKLGSPICCFICYALGVDQKIIAIFGSVQFSKTHYTPHHFLDEI